jgi:hypothetical protein
MKRLTQARAFIVGSLSDLTFIGGFLWFELSLAQWAGPAVAGMVGGLMLMTLAAWPYVVRIRARTRPSSER